MKQQRSGPGKPVINGSISLYLFLLAGLVFITACESNLEKVQAIISVKEFPDASGYNYEILYSDSMRVQVRILATEIRSFSRADEPYIEFPQGMTAYFYNDSIEVISYIRAKHVVYYENEALWEAKNDVEAQNYENGNKINTEHMFWDERKKEIYSHTHSRIVNEDGTFYGENGFIAKQDLSWYRLIGINNSTVIVRDE
jgi:hypothetical protein